MIKSYYIYNSNLKKFEKVTKKVFLKWRKEGNIAEWPDNNFVFIDVNDVVCATISLVSSDTIDALVQFLSGQKTQDVKVEINHYNLIKIVNEEINNCLGWMSAAESYTHEQMQCNARNIAQTVVNRTLQKLNIKVL